MNWFKNEHDKQSETVRQLFNDKVSKYEALINHLRAFNTLEQNYSKGMTDLSAAIARDCSNQDSYEATTSHIALLLRIKAAQSSKFASELSDLIEKDISKFFNEYKFGLQNIFKDLRLIGRKVEEMKNDFTLSEGTYKTLKSGSLVESFRHNHFLKKGVSNEANGMKYKEQFLKLIRDIFNTKEEFEKQIAKIKTALKVYDRKHFEFTRDLIMKIYIYQMSALKNLEYDLGGSIDKYKEKGAYLNAFQASVDSLEVPEQAFFDKVKQEMYATEHDYLFTEISDEQYNVYDFKVFRQDAFLLAKLFDNELLQVQDKVRLQNMAKSDKDDGAVFFAHFLHNLLRNRNNIVTINRETYDFLKTCLLRPFIRKLVSNHNYRGLFRLTCNWQHVKVKDNELLLLSDLKNEDFVKAEDFWLESMYAIFSPYKNGGARGKNIKAMLLRNYNSCCRLLGNKEGQSVFSSIIELKLGVTMDYLRSFKDAEPINEHSLVFYTEDDVQKKLNIFDD